MGIFFLYPNKGHLNLVEDQVFKVMKMLLSVYLTMEFLCKANNNKQWSYTYPCFYATNPSSFMNTHFLPLEV